MKTIICIITLICIFSLNTFSQQLRVHESQRYLETADGKPFLWIGDTAWELFHKLNREEATEYLENRVAKGFSVIQAVVLAENDGLRIPNSQQKCFFTHELIEFYFVLQFLNAKFGNSLRFAK